MASFTTRLAPALSLLIGACVDPGAELDEFADRLAESTGGFGGVAVDAGVDAGACDPEPGFVEGQYLLTLSVSIARTRPILALLDVSTPAAAEGVALAFVAQPLSASDRMTPAGQPITAGPFPLGPSGSFSAALPDLQVSGAANPITGSDISADLTLVGNLCGDPGFFCGIIEGSVTSPIMQDLMGSTFTMVRVEPAQSLPDRPPINCAMDLADPL